MKLFLRFCLFLMACFLSLPLFAVTLRTVITHTVKTNPDILIKSSQRKQVSERVWQALSGFFPTVDVGASVGRQDSFNSSTNFAWRTLNQNNKDVSVSENLFSGFKSYYSVKENRSKEISSRLSTNAAADNVALLAADVFLNVLRAKELLTVAKNNVALHRKTFILIKKRTDMGKSSRAESALAAGRLAVAEAAYINQEKAVQNAMADYIQVTGESPVGLEKPQSTILYADIPSSREAIGVALLNNPKLREAKSNIKASGYAYKSNISTFLPSVDISYTRDDGRNLSGVIGRSESNTALLSLNWNLFRGGSDYAQLKALAYKRIETRDENAKLEREIMQDTALAFDQLHADLRTLPKNKAHMDKTAFVVRAYKKQYTAGRRSLLDLLNTESEYFRSKQQYIDKGYDILLSKYTLLTEMGLFLRAMQVDEPNASHLSLPFDIKKYPSIKQLEAAINNINTNTPAIPAP